MQVLVDRVEGGVAIARSSSDAPEIDGIVRIRGAHQLAVGDWAQVRVTRSGAYDLEAKLETRAPE
jgi:ribosomal protein S12 methylthiotransferase